MTHDQAKAIAESRADQCWATLREVLAEQPDSVRVVAGALDHEDISVLRFQPDEVLDIVRLLAVAALYEAAVRTICADGCE
jgi:putative heme iron utilization protein